jgi:hypothetical protein
VRRRPDLALAILLGTFGAALAGDAWLIRHGRPPVTDWLRTPGGLAGQMILLGHSADVLGRADPFRFAAERVRRS